MPATNAKNRLDYTEKSWCKFAAKSDTRNTGRSNVRQIDQLTGVRGFAALWVLFHHMPNIKVLTPYLSASVLAPLFDKGWLGVDLFYVLSGFVVSFVHLEEFAHPTALKIKRFRVLRLRRP